MGVEVNLSPFPNKLIRHQYLEIRAREAPTCCIFQVLETLQAQLHTPLTPPPSLNIIIYVEVIINIIINIKKNMRGSLPYFHLLPTWNTFTSVNETKVYSSDYKDASVRDGSNSFSFIWSL